MDTGDLDHIQQSIAEVIKYYSENPDAGHVTDSAATATIEEGLRVRTEGPSGYSVVTDMPDAVGGGCSESPGWLFRAALASCDATVLQMRAAQEGITLTSLEVTVDSESDDRGIFGIEDSVPAGPLSVRTHFRLGAPNVAPGRLNELVEWVDEHSPVADLVRRVVPSDVEVDIN